LYLEAREMRDAEDEEKTNGVVELLTKLLERLAKKDLEANLTAEAIMLEPPLSLNLVVLKPYTTKLTN